ncbi:iron-sulfur cluster biosynthesis transcriptional regulator SufR [Leptolyngbya sp. 'hensonii']|uniref:iron-sulfur cluster biosynthesis transcriptional regulator SufR n=1 Tax=Leptolyngbya sp. 'hensonii' TaxID=1922337 RepID=UPI00094F5AE0|nr:iron-sulfur cluster biosynthesis transcriptional regulator SufR [Leptolyngbya sp. 'hensonii']OLP19043.1 iron-sulfur cluster biosynthesis transcriptional regulator SufR [Leptolyngbya sp. 'hensonii']
MVTTQQPSTKEDILRYLLQRGQAKAQELAEHLQVTPQAIRRHLKDLEIEGLVLHQTVQVGMGRPQYVYQLSREGHDRFPAQYDEFAVSLLETLSETIGHDQVSTILHKQWQRKAVDYRDSMGLGPLGERIAKLVELRQAEGYMAEWHQLEPEDNEEKPNSRFIVTEYNCAISRVAQSYPTICDHELELFKAALQDCMVERTHWIVNGEHRCGYLIKAR